MKTQKKTTRHYHLRRVASGMTPVREHWMNYWANLRAKLMKKGFTQKQAGRLAVRTLGLKDSDRDGTPDKIDCQPHNPNAQDWTKWDYTTARQKLKEGRVKDSKKVSENIRLEKRGEDIAFKLHDTDIVTFHPDGSVTLDSGGWLTHTTKERINQVLPEGYRLIQEKRQWYVTDPTGNKYVFEDGMRISTQGVSGAKPYSKENVKKPSGVKRQVDKYAKGYVEALMAGKIGKPSGGDCWHCAMRTQEGKSLGDMAKDSDHLESHVKEKYYVPSLLFNAMEEVPVSIIAKQTAGTMIAGTPEQKKQATELAGMSDIAQRQITDSIRRYMYRRMGLAR